jgi:hypothetical protein
MYISRVACIKGGLPQDTTALTVNRLCGSGLQAIVSAVTPFNTRDSAGSGRRSVGRPWPRTMSSVRARFRFMGLKART